MLIHVVFLIIRDYWCEIKPPIVFVCVCVQTHKVSLVSVCPSSFHLLLILFIAVEVTLTQDAHSISAAVMTASQPVSKGVKGQRHMVAERIGFISAQQRPLEAPCRINLMHFKLHIGSHRRSFVPIFRLLALTLSDCRGATTSVGYNPSFRDVMSA